MNKSDSVEGKANYIDERYLSLTISILQRESTGIVAIFL
jgi:hypothetical protein